MPPNLVPASFSSQNTLLLDLSTHSTISVPKSMGLLPLPMLPLTKGQISLSCLRSSNAISSRKPSLTHGF